MPLAPGTQLGQIRVEHMLGSGGMSEVYYGFHTVLERPVALKVVREDRRMSPLAKARFMREAKILSQLDHPGICRVYDVIVGEYEDVLVLEYIEGRNLRQLLASGLDEEEKLRIAIKVAEVLEIAHNHEIVHRDLKPENVMVATDGAVKVLDFDLARPVQKYPADQFLTQGADEFSGQTLRPPAEDQLALDDGIDTETKLGSIVGTVAYMSPEQARGEVVSVKADLYSLGIILHELIDGELPYPGKVPLRQRLMQVSEGHVREVEHGEKDLRKLVEALKSLDPSLRPPAREVVSRLSTILARRVKNRRFGLRAVVRLLARTSHQLPAATGDAPCPVAFSRIGMLDGQSSTTPRPSGRKPHWTQHLAALVTKLGEKCGLGWQSKSKGG